MNLSPPRTALGTASSSTLVRSGSHLAPLIQASCHRKNFCQEIVDVLGAKHDITIGWPIPALARPARLIFVTVHEDAEFARDRKGRDRLSTSTRA
jgi:hypothetical protein